MSDVPVNFVNIIPSCPIPVWLRKVSEDAFRRDWDSFLLSCLLQASSKPGGRQQGRQQGFSASGSGKDQGFSQGPPPPQKPPGKGQGKGTGNVKQQRAEDVRVGLKKKDTDRFRLAVGFTHGMESLGMLREDHAPLRNLCTLHGLWGWFEQYDSLRTELYSDEALRELFPDLQLCMPAILMSRDPCNERAYQWAKHGSKMRWSLLEYFRNIVTLTKQINSGMTEILTGLIDSLKLERSFITGYYKVEASLVQAEIQKKFNAPATLITDQRAGKNLLVGMDFKLDENLKMINIFSGVIPRNVKKQKLPIGILYFKMP